MTNIHSFFGIHTAPRDDLKISSARRFDETPLAVPWDFICDSQGSIPVDKFVSELRTIVGMLAPIPTSGHDIKVEHNVRKDYDSCQFVFVRRNKSHTPLQRCYHGPYNFSKVEPEHLNLDIGGHTETI
ncbi:hypothetical protein RF11_03205 [Thelohanellus kitauei]|uniref:Uncharacterized protein n=1 Tax=Thelohanellus kitauei TaxID=669202 RepID=A0A0C2MYD3_THEKT|nr:hypothetical protein RF11_03205 [Thelohanellus kitauei]